MSEPTDNQTAYGDEDRDPPSSAVDSSRGSKGPDRDPDDGDDPAGGRAAEQAHGGSMAPGLVDATGRQVAEPPPTGEDG